jgi:hypothetical protein
MGAELASVQEVPERLAVDAIPFSRGPSAPHFPQLGREADPGAAT